jgi:DNA modification methylase
MAKTFDLSNNPGRAITGELRKRSRSRRETLREIAPLHHSARNDLTPRLSLVELAPDVLVLPSRNVRKIDPAQVRRVVNSIREAGFCSPVLIDRQNNVLDGVARVEAAKLLGLRRIPCVLADHLDRQTGRLLRLAINRLGEMGTWDFEMLKLEFEELVVQDAPVEITGFSHIEIDQILLDDGVSATEPGPVAPEPDAAPVARLGDHFILGEHQVVCGDATDPRVLAALMGDDRARLLLTDEPYNVPIAGNVTRGAHREFAMASGEMSNEQFQSFNERWMAAALPYLHDGALLGTFIDWRGNPIVHAAAAKLNLTPINLVVWVKTNAGMGSLFRSQHELLPLFKKGNSSHINNVALGKHGRWRSNVWTYPGASSLGSDARRGLQDHPTVKPVAMLEDAMLDLTNRGDVVLDPFLGSGSALIAAEKVARKCRGIELDPLYVDVILCRYSAFSGKPVTLRSTGESFSELAERRQREQGHAVATDR